MKLRYSMYIRNTWYYAFTSNYVTVYTSCNIRRVHGDTVPRKPNVVPFAVLLLLSNNYRRETINRTSFNELRSPLIIRSIRVWYKDDYSVTKSQEFVNKIWKSSYFILSTSYYCFVVLYKFYEKYYSLYYSESTSASSSFFFFFW